MSPGYGVLLFLAPTLIAMFRRAPSPGVVALVNVVVGWTVIGWFVALLLAMRRRPVAYEPGPAVQQYFITCEADHSDHQIINARALPHRGE